MRAAVKERPSSLSLLWRPPLHLPRREKKSAGTGWGLGVGLCLAVRRRPKRALQMSMHTTFLHKNVFFF